MNLQILMATMFKSRLQDLRIAEKGITTDILIINQADMIDVETVGNIKMISNKERGSSKSRNKALENATGDICLISDDDVSYLPNYENTVLEAFNNNPDADIITFQIQTPDGEKFKNNYIMEERWHSKNSILKCASIEIAFKLNKVLANDIKFDEEFGLGSKYRVHDEIIFLMDAIKKGLKIRYIPEPIVIHPKESSGTNFNDHLITSKGAAFIRLYGLIGLFYNIIFSIKKFSSYRNKYSFLKFMKLMNSGSIEYMKTHRVNKRI